MVGKDTLTMMAGLTMKERAQYIKENNDLNLLPSELRTWYAKNKITCQELVHQVRPKGVKPYEVEQAELADVKAKYLELKEAGYELVQMDECLFNTNTYQQKHWAPSGDPLTTATKWTAP